MGESSQPLSHENLHLYPSSQTMLNLNANISNKTNCKARNINSQNSSHLIESNDEMENLENKSNLNIFDRRKDELKVGYLEKQRGGKWKSKRWHHRWFVLDLRTGDLTYYKYATNISFRDTSPTPFLPTSPKSICHHEHEIRGILNLKSIGTTLTILGDASKYSPTPFCFKISKMINSNHKDKDLHLCAPNEHEFNLWISALSNVMTPSSFLPSDIPSLPSKTKDKLSTKTSTPLVVSSISLQQSKNLKVSEDIFCCNKLHIGIGFLLLLSPITLIVRCGNWQIVLLSILLINIYTHYTLSFSFNKFSTKKSRDYKVDLASINDSTEEVPTNHLNSIQYDSVDNIIKTKGLSISTRQLNAFVNENKVKPGTSLKKYDYFDQNTVEEDIKNCWEEIDGTRFKVRQGPNYRKTKLKSNSKASLLKLENVDIFKTSSKVDNIGRKIDLPMHNAKID